MTHYIPLVVEKDFGYVVPGGGGSVTGVSG